MYRLLPLIVLLLAPWSWAQESDDAATPDDTEAAAAESDETDTDELDDLDDLGDLYPVEDEDEFIPSEDVAFGQSIPFPTDI